MGLKLWQSHVKMWVGIYPFQSHLYRGMLRLTLSQEQLQKINKINFYISHFNLYQIPISIIQEPLYFTCHKIQISIQFMIHSVFEFIGHCDHKLKSFMQRWQGSERILPSGHSLTTLVNPYMCCTGHGWHVDYILDAYWHMSQHIIVEIYIPIQYNICNFYSIPSTLFTNFKETRHLPLPLCHECKIRRDQVLSVSVTNYFLFIWQIWYIS